jgi:hypothetical protein
MAPSRFRQSAHETTRVARWHKYFQTKNPDLVKFWRALEWKMLVCAMAICNLHITAIWYMYFGNLVSIWYIFTRYGILCQEKSGNPGHDHAPRLIGPTELRN